MSHVVAARHPGAFFTTRFPWRQGRLLFAVLLTVGLVMTQSAGRVHAFSINPEVGNAAYIGQTLVVMSCTNVQYTAGLT